MDELDEILAEKQDEMIEEEDFMIQILPSTPPDPRAGIFWVPEEDDIISDEAGEEDEATLRLEGEEEKAVGTFTLPLHGAATPTTAAPEPESADDTRA